MPPRTRRKIRRRDPGTKQAATGRQGYITPPKSRKKGPIKKNRGLKSKLAGTTFLAGIRKKTGQREVPSRDYQLEKQDEWIAKVGARKERGASNKGKSKVLRRRGRRR